jgi:hypothetical protein
MTEERQKQLNREVENLNVRLENLKEKREELYMELSLIHISENNIMKQVRAIELERAF